MTNRRPPSSLILTAKKPPTTSPQVSAEVSPSPLLPSPQEWSRLPVSLPSSSGVYWYLGAAGNILYVGKAKNLNHRLRSYARLNHLLPKTRKLVEEAAGVRYQPTDSELDALILEAELVRLHQPPYNILLKDDKSPLYIALTKEIYPRVITARKGIKTYRHIPIQHYFGPYPSSRQVKSLLTLVRKAFPYCNATPQEKKHHRACFYYHLHLCPGACTGEITPKDYNQIIKNLRLFLRGKKQQLLKDLQHRIRAASQSQDYEKAAAEKKQLDTLRYITKNYHSRWDDQPLPNLTEDISHNRLLHLRRLLTTHMQLPNDYPLKRIETYDVSNTSGKEATVSLITLTNGVPDKSEYKRFRIKTLDTPNDPAMLKEALSRRVKHEEWGIPNLIILDGGKGQLRIVKPVIPWSIPVVGIAKDPDRLVIPTPLGIKPYVIIPLTPDNPASSLIQQGRDEAHRFAKKYHSLLRTKKLLK